jgi:hypothetical protein
MNFILFKVWTLSEMRDQQAKLFSDAQSLDGSIRTCTALDTTMRTNWKLFFDQLSAFAQEIPVYLIPTETKEVLATGTRADLLQNYQAELVAWQKLLGGKCLLNRPEFTPPSTGFGLDLGFKYIAVAGGFVASAWIAHEVVKGIGLFRKVKA